MQNQRGTARWCINHPAKLMLAGAVAHSICQIKDINLRGMQVMLKIRLCVDTFLKFKLTLSNGDTFDLEGWVVWHKAIDGHNLYGIYFTKIKDLDREKIYQYLRSNFMSQINEVWWRGEYQQEKGGQRPMGIKQNEDNRVFERFQANIPARLLNPDTGTEIQAQTCDVCAKGIGFISSVPLVVRTPIEVWLQLPDKGEPLYTRGEVVYSLATSANTYRSGVHLEKADLMGFGRVLRTK